MSDPITGVTSTSTSLCEPEIGVDRSTLYSLKVVSVLRELSIKDKIGDEKGRMLSIDFFNNTLELNLKKSSAAEFTMFISLCSSIIIIGKVIEFMTCLCILVSLIILIA